jgi:co-chaperonin GroES (HSP10)
VSEVKAYGGRVLVQFEAKPTKSATGAVLLPLSQQVEPNWARIVSVGHLVRERIPVGCRAMVKQHMNGEPLEGTPYHWLTEDSVLGVEER